MARSFRATTVTMHIANINNVRAKLSQLIKRVLAGDEVVIDCTNEPLVRLERCLQDTRPRVGGQWAGMVVMGDDFQFTDQEIEELFHAPVYPAAKC